MAILNAPVSKDDAAKKFSEMYDKYSQLAVDIKNDVSVLDVSKLREDAKNIVSTIEDNVKQLKETKWPEGLSGNDKYIMDLYIEGLEAERDFYQRIVNASDEDMFNIYGKDYYALLSSGSDEIRKKLGLPSEATEKDKFHEYTEDEVSKKLQETAIDITLGKFNISCKTEYSYTHCDSSMDTAVRNKSGINFTNGGSIDVTAYDQSGNPIDTDTIYLGNRLENGQTAKQKIFDYVRDEHRSDFQNNPSFKVTKVQIYNY